MTVLIYCDGGLANRINAMISGMALAALLDRPHLMIWPCNNRCGAPFEDLFEPHCPVLRGGPLQDLVPYESTLRPWLHENDVGFTSAFLGLRGIDGPDAAKALAAGDDRPILFCENMILPWLPAELVQAAFDRLAFRPAIVARTREVLGPHAPGGYFGIHLRGTDFVPPAPVDAMLDVVAKNPNLPFFVCSDEEATEQRFAQFANVFVHPKSAYVNKLADGAWRQWVTDSDGLPYTSNIDRTADSVVQACVDLLLLAAAVPIRTSHSSFLALAERLRDTGVVARQLGGAPA